MSVYAKKLSPAWRKAFAQFESLSGFEIMHQEAIDAGEMTAQEAWDRNQEWLEDHTNEVSRIRTPPLPHQICKR